MERAVASRIRGASDGLKQDLREDDAAAEASERLLRPWWGKTFPEVGESAKAAAYVWSRAPKIVDEDHGPDHVGDQVQGSINHDHAALRRRQRRWRRGAAGAGVLARVR
jgi:hypothetical protein